MAPRSGSTACRSRPALVSDFGAAWPDLALGGGEDFELVGDPAAGGAAGALVKIVARRSSLRSRSSDVCATAPASTFSIREGGTLVPRTANELAALRDERRAGGGAMLDRG